MISQTEHYGQHMVNFHLNNSLKISIYKIHVSRIELTENGMERIGDPWPLLIAPLVFDNQLICTMREDAPELIIAFGPGLNIVRVNADAEAPQEPLDRFNVAGSDLALIRHIYFYQGLFWIVVALSILI